MYSLWICKNKLHIIKLRNYEENDFLVDKHPSVGVLS